jgi:hypothetical protein
LMHVSHFCCVPAFLPAHPADIPNALLRAAVVRDGVRPIWPGSSGGNMAAAGATGTSSVPAGQQQQQQGGDAAAAAAVLELFPPAEYRRLAEACWQHEPQDRWGLRPALLNISTSLSDDLMRADQRGLSILLTCTVYATCCEMQRVCCPAGCICSRCRTASAISACQRHCHV